MLYVGEFQVFEQAWLVFVIYPLHKLFTNFRPCGTETVLSGLYHGTLKEREFLWNIVKVTNETA